MDTVFDPQRMIMGDTGWLFLAEIVVRTSTLYVYTIGMVRLLGRRGAEPFAPFELVIIIALGSAVGDPMFYPDVPLAHGIVVVTVIVLLERGVALVIGHFPVADGLLEAPPVLIVQQGELQGETLENESISRDDIFSALRLAGVANLGEIEYAFLEPSGRVSVFRAEHPVTGLSILPLPGDAGAMDSVAAARAHEKRDPGGKRAS